MEAKLAAFQIELTNACQLACAECPRVLMSRPVGMMDIELAKILVLDGLEHDPTIGFNLNGLGEPLLYPKMAEFIDFMTANGVQHFDFFTSLAAPTRLVDQAFQALSRSTAKITMVATKHLYRGDGVCQPQLKPFDEHFEMMMRLPDHVDKHISMVATKYHSVETLDKFAEEFRPRMKEGNVHVIKNLNPWFNLVKDMAHEEYGADKGATSPSICDYPFILLHVGWNGDVIICCTDDVDGEAVFGRIKERGDAMRIWNGPGLQKVREDFNNYIIKGSPCDKCERTAWARPQKVEEQKQEEQGSGEEAKVETTEVSTSIEGTGPVPLPVSEEPKEVAEEAAMI